MARGTEGLTAWRVAPLGLALVPLLTVAIGATGGWPLATASALLLPAIVLGIAYLPHRRLRARDNPGSPQGALLAALGTALTRDRVASAGVTCVLLAAERLGDPDGQTDPAVIETALDQISSRLSSALRDGDTVLRLDGGRFGVVLDAGAHGDLEALMQIAARLHRAASDPLLIGAVRLRPRMSLGLCRAGQLSDATDATASALLDAAQTALMEAQCAGGGAMRIYAQAMRQQRDARESLVSMAASALESGEITAWFQPQVSTDTGRVTGFEALARWTHPESGAIPPADFLPALANAGLTERLGEIMVDQALRALAAWDRDGLQVPSVGVNLAQADLDRPRLADRIAWQIDRFDLDPGRLTVEVLESVVAATAGDTTARNIAALADLGCHVDLDDFGTGHASLTTLRHLRIGRVKIDRSFVTGVDADRDQQKMVTTILSMCEHLGLDTLAEGVETAAEHSMLAQLGCGHVQGYAIARPMPFAHTASWLSDHAARIGRGPELRRKSP